MNRGEEAGFYNQQVRTGMEEQQYHQVHCSQLHNFCIIKVHACTENTIANFLHWHEGFFGSDQRCLSKIKLAVELCYCTAPAL